MQQSAAFKILKTRLKAVPSYSFNGEQLKKTSSGNPYQFLQHMSGGSHTAEDGDVAADSGNSHNGINFVARLNQFQQMQKQHREHFRAQAQIRKNSTSVLKVTTDLFILHVKYIVYLD
jgi:vacuole morphology and inheritance protein 14